MESKTLQESLEVLVSLEVWTNLKLEKKLEDEELSYKMTGPNESGDSQEK